MTVPLTVLPQTGIRQSTANDFLTCGRYGMFKHLCGLRSRSAIRSDALDIGTLLHAHVEQRVTDRKAVARELSRIRSEIADAAGETPDKALSMLRDLEENAALAAAMASVWFQRYPTDPKKKLLGSEIKVTARIVGIPLPVTGTLDLMWGLPNGEIDIDDFKTCSESPASRASTIPFEFQTQLYPVLAAEYCRLSGLKWRKIRRFNHCLVQKGAIRLSGKDRDRCEADPKKYPTPLAAYTARYLEWVTATGEYLKDRDAVTLSPRMRKSTTTVDVSSLRPTRVGDEIWWETGDSIDRETFLTLQRIARQMQEAGDAGLDLADWPRVRSACRKYGGECEFLPLCSSESLGGLATWPALLEDRYRVATKDD